MLKRQCIMGIPAMPIGTDDLTDDSVFRAQTEPGMAHFAGTGPKGKTCGNCSYWGYQKVGKARINREGEEYFPTTAHEGCKKFYELTNRHGPAIEAGLLACKYFNDKPLPPPPRGRR